MVGSNHFREIVKDSTLKKKRLHAIKYSSQQGKKLFLEQLLYFESQSLLSFYFNKILVHL